MSTPDLNVTNLASSQTEQEFKESRLQALMAMAWEQRRVNELMQISFQGWLWSVLPLPGVCVGDLLQVRTGSASCVQCRPAGSEQPPCTLAWPVAPVRNHLHSSPLSCNGKNLDSWTTCGGPACQGACPAPDAERTPPSPPCATPEAHRRSRIGCTAHVVPGVGPKPIVWVLPLECWAELQRRKPSSDREEFASCGSVNSVVDESALCQRKPGFNHFQNVICLDEPTAQAFPKNASSGNGGLQ